MAATDPTPRFTIRDRLRLARQAMRLEQSELAENIGVSRQTVSHYETGATTRLKPIVLKQWALACNVSYEWLIDTAEDPESRNRCSTDLVPTELVAV